MVKDRLGGQEPGVSGLRLVEEMLGYKEAIIVDSYPSQDDEVGRVREFALEEFQETLRGSSPHG